MKTIKILLTHPNPLLRQLAKGLLKLGYQNLEIKSKRFHLLASREDHIIEIEKEKVLILDGTQNSTFWFCKRLTDENGKWIEDFWGEAIFQGEEIIWFLEKLKRCQLKSISPRIKNNEDN